MKNIFLIFLIAIILTFFAVLLKKQPIEQHLQEQVESGLSANNINNISVRMDGREVYLSGEVDFEKTREQTVSSVKDTWGVGGVHSSLVSAESKRLSLLEKVKSKINTDELKWAKANLDNGEIIVSGTTNSPDIYDRLKLALTELNKQVSNKTKIDWSDYLANILKINNLGHIDAHMQNDIVVLSGQAQSEAEIAKIIDIFNSDDRLNVVQNNIVLSEEAMAQIEELKIAQQQEAAEQAEAKAKELRQSTAIKNKLMNCKKEITVNSQIYFSSGQSVLSEQHIVMLANLAKFLNECPSIQIKIMSHTDADGSAQANKKLSDQRLKAAMDYLQKAKVAASQLSVESLGESQARPDSDEKSKKQERKIEWRIIN